MGIRVHKVIGYGLTDVKTKDHRILDPRFRDGFHDELYKREKTIKDYMKYVRTLPDDEMQSNKLELVFLKDKLKEREYFIYECFVHNGEYGISKVFMVVPVNELGLWNRYDDSIDYYQETQISKQRNWYKVFNNGIYPYSGLYMDDRTGKNVSNGVEFWRHVNSKVKDGGDTLAKFLGFSDVKECKKHLAPIIPEGIQMLCKYVKVFKDESTILQLRPMLYTYWS